MYARINSPAGFVRLLLLLAVFAFAGLVACEWLLANGSSASQASSDEFVELSR